MKDIHCLQVEITGGFWKNRQEINQMTTVDAIWSQFLKTHRVDAFLSDQNQPDSMPHEYWDSDVAKWMEAVSYLLGKGIRTELGDTLEKMIGCLEKRQREDGYLNTYFDQCAPEKRWTQRDMHELYCAGHLIEAAVAYFEATGSRRFLSIVERYAKHIETVFVKERSAEFTTPGHQEIELALLRLYRCTKDQQYLRLAEFFLESRGKDKEESKLYGSPLYVQDMPVREQREAQGHCVRALYLYSAMAEYAEISGDQEMLDTCRALFDDITCKKMYVTGAVGSTHIGEAFGSAFDLPNENAYAETCAAIGLIFFCQKMLHIERDAKYADVIERALYNAMLSGISLDGRLFFYENPLEIRLQSRERNQFVGRFCKTPEHFPLAKRSEDFVCFCCPPNLSRLLASLGGYLYGIDGGTVYVHQFAESSAEQDGIRIRQSTAYPAAGSVTIEVEGAQRLMIRIPAWCKSFTLDAPYTMIKGYACVESPDRPVTAVFDMEPFLVEADARVAQNTGCAAVQRGPIVYCAEAVDNGENLHALVLDGAMKAVFEDLYKADVIIAEGLRKQPGQALYTRRETRCESGAYERADIRMIPYFAFANRGESDMLVWLRCKENL